MHSCADYFTVATWRKLFFPSLLILIPSSVIKLLGTPEYHVVNHEYFRMIPDEQSMYLEYDQKFNLYKDVEDMKYNFKYRTLRDYYKTRRYALDSIQAAKKGWYKEYHQYQLGLKLDPF